MELSLIHNAIKSATVESRTNSLAREAPTEFLPHPFLYYHPGLEWEASGACSPREQRERQGRRGREIFRGCLVNLDTMSKIYPADNSMVQSIVVVEVVIH